MCIRDSLTSGLALVAVLVLLAWVWKACRPGHPARLGAGLSVFFMLTEAAVGAGLVLFELVADNASLARAMFMAVHLLNTFILVGSIALTAWWLSGGAPVTLRQGARPLAGVAGGCLGLLLVSSSGAVAALGDTLVQQGSLAHLVAAEMSVTSHALVRLRVIHPFVAVLVGLALIYGAPRLARGTPGPGPVLAAAVVALTAVQLAIGAVNVLLLAPVWIQMVHLLLADALWIAFVLLGAVVLARPAGVRAISTAA